MNVPQAFMAHTTVVVLPFSALTTLPTCLVPFFAIIRPGSCTVVIPVSSTLYICAAVYCCNLSSYRSKSKNLPTWTLLKPDKRERLVASGFRILSSGYRFIKLRAHSTPARFSACEKGCSIPFANVS